MRHVWMLGSLCLVFFPLHICFTVATTIYSYVYSNQYEYEHVSYATHDKRLTTHELMRALIQRVSEASVSVQNDLKGRIGQGLLILLGITHTDTVTDIEKLTEKIVNLRIFENDDGKFDLSILDTKGQALVVSQFTLYSDTAKGRRPSFIEAARPEVAEPLCEKFIESLKAKGVPTETGRFQTHMMVSLTNDGPVTLMIDSKKA